VTQAGDSADPTFGELPGKSMSARTIMIQGTASNVGKSVVTAALCAYFHEEGFRVAPFKSQNMSNNSFVTASGREIGRAQAFQAQACGIEPEIEMNPILIKPSAGNGAQVVVLGKPVSVMTTKQYHAFQPELAGITRDCFEKLATRYDIVVIEGAGSPAEINLRPFDIANMAVAKMAGAPVVLVGDIDLGGVFASLVGTLELLCADERALVKALLINKFRGEIGLLQTGIKFLETKTGKRVLGVLPFVQDLRVAEEDLIPQIPVNSGVGIDAGKLRIEVLHFPHISNTTDFEPFKSEPDVALQFLTRLPDSEPLPDALILPGSKSTIADLAYLRASGLDKYVVRCREARVPIIGICGGYQMLGNELLDPERVESDVVSGKGLSLLQLTTYFHRDKRTVRVRGKDVETGREVSGYEIHMGRTTASGTVRPLFQITEQMGSPTDRLDGAKSEDGLVWGTYLHGVFDTPAYRRDFLNGLRRRRGWPPLATASENSNETFRSLAALIREHVDLQVLHQILDCRS
jgi:adenosylcobyric acid synthase